MFAEHLDMQIVKKYYLDPLEQVKIITQVKKQKWPKFLTDQTIHMYIFLNQLSLFFSFNNYSSQA